MTPPSPSLLHVGLTGNIAAGKSTVAALFRDWGATLIDADAIVRRLQRRGTPVFQAIVDRFGPGVVAGHGGLDRGALRARILADPEAKRVLEGIVHPAVEAERQRLLRYAGRSPVGIVIHDIPLLFETMDPKRFAAVVLVDAPSELRRERIVHHRRIGAEEASRLLDAQQPAGPKRARADWVIDNDADTDRLRERAWLVWRKLVSRTHARA